MAKQVALAALDAQLNYIKTNATKMLLISAYTAGDSYATVNGNTLVSVTVTSTDFTISGTSNRILALPTGKSGTATGNASGIPPLHFAFTDGASTVILVTNDTSGLASITAGTVYNFPSLTYTAYQPT
jgi:hypothetical protein